METLVLEDDDPAAALLRYISELGITSLVLGSCSSNFIARYGIIFVLRVLHIHFS